MILFLAGASHTGKTLLAQRLMERYHIPYLSIDHLKMGLIRSGQTSLTPMDDDELTDYLWPILRELVKTAIENGQSLIVEGCYIPFDWAKDFPPEYLRRAHGAAKELDQGMGLPFLAFGLLFSEHCHIIDLQIEVHFL